MRFRREGTYDEGGEWEKISVRDGDGASVWTLTYGDPGAFARFAADREGFAGPRFATKYWSENEAMLMSLITADLLRAVYMTDADLVCVFTEKGLACVEGDEGGEPDGPPAPPPVP